MWRVCLLSCLISAALATNTYVVVLPKVVRPGLTLNVGVNILKAHGDVSVTATLVDTADNATIASVMGSIKQGEPKSLTIEVPRNLKSSKYRVEVAGQGGLVFRNSTLMEYNSKGLAIFIQTDKAMYKPGQTVHFRTFGVYPDLKPFTGTFSLELYDPNTNKIKQWLNLQDVSTVITNQFALSDQPVLGDWKIKVIANGKSEEKAFTVAEYVLPKFEVNVELPPFGLTRDSSLKGTVKAKYTYGKSVHGTAHIRVRNERWYRPFNFEGPEPIIETEIPIKDGKATFTFTMNQLRHVAHSINGNQNYDHLINHDIIVEANVTDALTGSMMNGSSKIHYYQQGVKLEWLKSNPKNFKPGLPYTAYLKISQQDGSPIVGLKKDVGLHTTVTYNLPDPTGTTPSFFYYPRTSTYELSDINMTVPDNGLVPIEVEIPDNATNINIRAKYHDASDMTLRIQKMNSPSNSYIQTFLKSSTLAAGQSAEFELKSTSPMTTVVYQIISRGSIVATGTANGQGSNLVTFSVPVTSKMAPNARIVVYFVREDGEIVTDSISFNVDGLFENQVSIRFDRTKAEPGQEVNVIVSADANSFVNLLAVDQSVLLLKSGNDITSKQVMEEIGSFDSVTPHYGGPIFFGGGMARLERREKRMMWWPYPYYYGGNDAGDIFRNAGVLVLTDALVFHHDEPILYFKGEIIMEKGSVAHAILDKGAKGGLAEVERVRKNFPETWLWSNTTVGENGTTTISTTVPDTITSWVASAFAINSVSGLGVSPTTAKLEAFRPFFVSLNLPYSVVRGEQVILQAIAFNYMSQDMDVLVTLENSDEFRNVMVDALGHTQVTSSVQTGTVRVKAGEAQSVYFPIIPATLGKIDVVVKAQSPVAADAVQRQLLVEAEGAPQEYNIPVLVDLKDTHTFSKTVPLSLPGGVVAGSQHARVTAIGDLMGPTVNNLDSLLQMPSGCGEQNMLNFAPDIFIMKYLTATKQLSSDIEQKATGFLEKGYQRELTYQHKDGSFSAFGDSDKSGSMWLTAFVVKSFHQAKPFIYIDDDAITRAIDWMISRQHEDGSFPEPGRIIHTNMQGGSASGTSLTAFVLIALLENDDLGGSAQQRIGRAAEKARAYLESQVMTMSNDYSLAITTLALTLAQSAIGDAALHKLNSHAVDQDGMRHWAAPEPTKTTTTHYWRQPNHSNARNVELTAYGLLSVAAKNDLTGGLPIMKWIVGQRNPRGGFMSTQDTVLALQALSQFAELIFSTDFNIEVDVTAGSFNKHFTINQGNALILQTADLSPIPSSLVVHATGHGMGLVEVSVSFNVEADVKEPSFEVHVQLLEETINSLTVQTCTRSLGTTSTGMAVQEIGVPSGFEAEVESIKKTNGLKRIETANRKVILYFDEFNTTPICVSMKAQRTGLVAKSQPVAVRVYDYYSPDDQITVFYQSQLLKQSSVCDVCGTECGCNKN